MDTDALAKPVVFLGPTMSHDDARGLLDARYMPPARNGDVLRVVESAPPAIVIIDGYFNWVPSVWHKEILFALDQGIPVHGASSMGALRAAELDGFGMIGWGKVYDDFRSGRLTDDDEVAVSHGDAESNYRGLSDAMVNIRATIDDAVADGVIDADAAAVLIDHAKARFFPERSLRLLAIDGDVECLLGRSTMAELRQWLPGHQRDVKRDDAVAVLTAIAAGCSAPVSPGAFEFQPTANWLRLVAAVGDDVGERPHGDDDTTLSRPVGSLDDLLTECRLSGQWPLLEAAAIARLDRRVDAAQEAATRDEIDGELARWCVARGYRDAGELEQWAASNGVGWNELFTLFRREVRMERLRSTGRAGLATVLREVLLLTGAHDALAQRARQRRRWKEGAGPRTSNDAVAEEAVDRFRLRYGLSSHEPAAWLARRHGWDHVDDMIEDLIDDADFTAAAGSEPRMPVF